MRSNYLKRTLKTAVLAVTILLLGVSASMAQTVNLTAQALTATLPDGSTVPMWGYSCGPIVAGSGVGSVTILTGGSGYVSPTATFSGGGGSGATASVTVTAGAITAITVTNSGVNYTSAPTLTITSATGPTTAATFTVNLVAGAVSCTGLNGQLQAAAPAWAPPLIKVPAGGGLVITLTNSLSFPTTGAAVNVPTSLVIVGQLGAGLGVAAQRTTDPSPDHSNAQALTWPIPGDMPGLPLTGVNPAPPQGPRVRSFSTEVVVGTPQTLTWNNLKPGTYLIESGTHPSIQGPMGLYGVLVVTTAPAGTTGGTAYPAVGTTPAVTYNTDIPLLLSEIDPAQNVSVDAAVRTAGFTETAVWSGQPGGCGNPAVGNANYHTCYPPAVNYTPLYYLINGVAFDKTNSTRSLFPDSISTACACTYRRSSAPSPHRLSSHRP